MEPANNINNKVLNLDITNSSPKKSVTDDLKLEKYSFIRKLFEGPILLFARIISFNLIYIASSDFREEWDRVFNDKEISLKSNDEVIKNINPNYPNNPQDQGSTTVTPKSTPKSEETNPPKKDEKFPDLNAARTFDPLPEPKRTTITEPNPSNTNAKFDLNSMLLCVTLEGKKTKVASASIGWIKEILKDVDGKSLAAEILPYLSDKQLNQLSLSDFSNEYQIALSLFGDQDGFMLILRQNNKHVDWGALSNMLITIKDGSLILSDIRRRFALIAKGQEVRASIEESKLSSNWLLYLDAEELISAYTFTDLVTKDMILKAFPLTILEFSKYLPGEKLRFAKFSFQDIQGYIKSLTPADCSTWLKDGLEFAGNSFKIWQAFSYLISPEQFKSFNFKDWNVQQISLIIVSKNWEELYKLFNKQQKNDIAKHSGTIDVVIKTRAEYAPSLLGIVHLLARWKEESAKA